MTTRNGFDVDVAKISRDDAIRFAGIAGDSLAGYAGIVRHYAGDILPELERMQEYRYETGEREYAQRCLIWAICTPMNDLDRSFRAMNRYIPHLYDVGQTKQSIAAILGGDGDAWKGYFNGCAAAILQSLPFLYAVDPEDMQKTTLRAVKKARGLRGLGEKAMAMAIAPFNPDADVYTLDRFMLRGVAGMLGTPLGGNMEIGEPAYRIVESACITWHRETFPGLPVFVSQWALWNYWRDDTHASHLALID